MPKGTARGEHQEGEDVGGVLGRQGEVVSLALVTPQTPAQAVVENLRRVADQIEAGDTVVDRGVMVLQDRRSGEITLVELADGHSVCSEDIGLLQFAIQMRWDKFQGRL